KATFYLRRWLQNNFWMRFQDEEFSCCKGDDFKFIFPKKPDVCRPSVCIVGFESVFNMNDLHGSLLLRHYGNNIKTHFLSPIVGLQKFVCSTNEQTHFSFIHRFLRFYKNSVRSGFYLNNDDHSEMLRNNVDFRFLPTEIPRNHSVSFLLKKFYGLIFCLFPYFVMLRHQRSICIELSFEPTISRIFIRMMSGKLCSICPL